MKTRNVSQPQVVSRWGFRAFLLYNLITSVTPLQDHTAASQCVCPGQHLIYTCTVCGEMTGATIWNGTAFNGCPQDEIILPHSQFTSTRGSIDMCNEGDIVGQGLRVEGNSYISQLNVTITNHTVGKTIVCAYDALTADSASDMIHLFTTVPGPFQKPIGIHLSTANFISRQYTFSWSPVAFECSTVHYNIVASNCGSCPTTTNHTTVTCTDVPSNGKTCIFAVKTVVCGNFAGSLSNTINVTTHPWPNTKDKGQVISSTLLGILFVIWVAISVAVIIILVKGNIKIKQELEQTRGLLKTNSSPSGCGIAPVTAIKTADNIAYDMHTVTMSCSQTD